MNGSHDSVLYKTSPTSVVTLNDVLQRRSTGIRLGNGDQLRLTSSEEGEWATVRLDYVTVTATEFARRSMTCVSGRLRFRYAASSVRNRQTEKCRSAFRTAACDECTPSFLHRRRSFDAFDDEVLAPLRTVRAREDDEARVLFKERMVDKVLVGRLRLDRSFFFVAVDMDEEQ